MDKNRTLELITGSLNAAEKIKALKSLPAGSRGSQQDYTPILEIIEIMSRYSPEKHREPMTKAVDRSRRYLDTFMNLKKHIGTMENRTINGRNLIDTLNVIKPALGEKEGVLLTKIITIYELLSN